MADVMSSLEPTVEDFGGGAGGDEHPICSDTHERYPKLSKRLPSIVVEPTDGTEVESGELRWPPDDPGTPEAKRESSEAQTAGKEHFQESPDRAASGTETHDSN